MRELTPLEYLQVQARKNRPRVPKPDMIQPDAFCYGYDRPKAAFYTEGKAYKALEIARQRREAEGNPQREDRFYECTMNRQRSHLSKKHFHLTSMSKGEYDKLYGPKESDDVSAD